ncbi:MAG TPA: hypothetical protein VHV47_03550 [Opitutaceae bacterium]|jgi:hypothetical protein|nr:hypothetical protein [Opitutaceae bacterium]
MKTLALRLAALAAVLPLLRGQDQPPAAIVQMAPLKNWALQLRTDEGYPAMTLRGTEVHPITVKHIDIVDLNMTVFSGTPAAEIDTSVLSPAASYFPQQRLVSGPGEVRVLDYRHGLEVTGEQWTYTYGPHWKKISIAKHAHVVLTAPVSNPSP